ncbi:hypothetical protein HJC23_008800 [Cyclotella cryptica]|uniref:Uncharacterized protein n=1 Tax=Cyclotella cryptica TaxID=29204 RepID=A0ABD3PSB9_9STRA
MRGTSCESRAIRYWNVSNHNGDAFGLILFVKHFRRRVAVQNYGNALLPSVVDVQSSIEHYPILYFERAIRLFIGEDVRFVRGKRGGETIARPIFEAGPMEGLRAFGFFSPSHFEFRVRCCVTCCGDRGDGLWERRRRRVVALGVRGILRVRL